jgi:formyltetrahydrofolate-dependent phosphoribosylglycinamide formyltransferase
MAALASACRSGSIDAETALVISPKAGTKAVLRAEALEVPVKVLHHKSESYADDLLSALAEAEIDLICLAGYMTLLPAAVVHAYEDRILNIHPALLPKFGGKGMYGMHVHEAVIAAGESESGCSVHFVNEVYDDGALLHQKRCPIEPGETPESLAEKVLDLEHLAYVEAVQIMAARLA